MRALRFAVVLFAFAVSARGPAAADSLFQVDYSGLVGRADLTYEGPTARSEEGLPVGNGRMGSLVWTTPTALKFQINRVDVFASNCQTNSFPERHSDYCNGCGFVDIDFVDFGEDVFPQGRTSQRLSCYDALVDVAGAGVSAQVLAWHEQDVMAVKVTDERQSPAAIKVSLRMLRPVTVQRRSHTATSKLVCREERIVLTQQFVEGDYSCGSAVAVGVLGRRSKTKQVNEQEFQLVVEPGRGSFTILMASAASFNREDDVVASALAQLEAAQGKGYAGLVESNGKWWRDFWARSFVHLHSADGVADDIERHYTYYLYVMASSSRGKYPPKFNGMLWTTGGDLRKWGAQYWGANQSCLYNALLPTNRLELTDPMFDMYTAMYDSCALAARQQWGSRGIYIPETTAFDGLEELPEDVAEEMRDLYLSRKPWEDRSERFRTYAFPKQPHASRWNWKAAGRWEDGQWRYTDKGAGPYAQVNHIFSRGAKIAYEYWRRYEYTLDEDWLRDRAYPVLKGVAEFYRNYPNVRKEADGLYHINNVNSNEPLWGGRDTDEEISAMRGVVPVVIRASEILDVDSEMRPIWREFLDHLAPLPLSQSNPPTWIKGLAPIVKGRGDSLPDRNTMPMWYFDLCTLETAEPESLEVANATFDAFFRGGIEPDTRIGVLSKLAVVAALLGRAEDVKVLLPNQIHTRETPILTNRMTLREGVQTTGLQRIGRAADALHAALCQSVPAKPGAAPVIRVFAAWPKDWDAAFTLLARGAFLVGSAQRDGRIPMVEIRSQAGSECRLANPWGSADVTLFRDGAKAEDLSGAALTLPTRKGETIVVVPRGSKPSPVVVF